MPAPAIAALCISLAALVLLCVAIGIWLRRRRASRGEHARVRSDSLTSDTGSVGSGGKNREVVDEKEVDEKEAEEEWSGRMGLSLPRRGW